MEDGRLLTVRPTGTGAGVSIYPVP